MSKDPIKMMQGCLGAVIEGLEIDPVSETVKFTLNKGVIELEGEYLEMYIDIEEYDQ